MTSRALYPSCLRFAAWISPLRWWTWRTTRRVLFATALLLTLLTLLYTVENRRGRRAFAAVTQEAAASGISFTLNDYAPPPVPDELNLAKIPLFDHPLSEDPQAPYWEDLMEQFWLRRPAPAQAMPLPGFGGPNPYTNSSVTFERIRTKLAESSSKWGTETLDAYLQRISPVMAQLDPAVLDRPYLRYEGAWDKPSSVFYGHFGQINGAAALQALVDLSDRHPAEAARALCIPLRFGSALGRFKPAVIVPFMASWCNEAAIRVIWQAQLDHRWTVTELALFAKLLSEDQILADFRRAFAADAAIDISISLQFTDPALPLPKGYLSDHPLLARAFKWAPDGWAHQAAARLGRLALDCSLPAIDPVAGRVYPDAIRRASEVLSGPLPYCAFTRAMTLPTPILERFVRNIGRAKTTHDLARLAVALEQHLLEHGAYPESLAPVLAANPALAALHDPFTGEPYRYHRDPDGGFTLWGVGQNGRDDSAAFATKDKNGNDDYGTGDLVWRVPGPAAATDAAQGTRR